VSASEVTDNRAYYSFACVDKFRKQLHASALTLATDIIGIGYKNIYLRQELNIHSDSFLLNTLINTMCIFDSSFDRQFIKRVVELDGTVCFDGYFNFRMKRLKDKWAEIVELTKNNSIILSDDSLIEEFLAYLIDAIPESIKNLSVCIEKGKIVLFDSQSRVVPLIDILRLEATPEETAMVNIICLKPATVTLYCDDTATNPEFLTLTKFLFDTKVVKNS
jgi:hypothetical protein